MPHEDAQLKEAVLEHGARDWVKISTLVLRTADDCRDRWRNHVKHKQVREYGVWSKAEEDELKKIVLEETVEKGLDMEHEVFWSAVSERMDHRRSQQQCRGKW